MQYMFEDYLAGECKLVWLLPIDDIPYVREVQGSFEHPSDEPDWSGSDRVLVGYTTVNVKGGRDHDPPVYWRRIFHLMTHDRHFDPGGVYAKMEPCEAVRPQDVAVGKPTLRLSALRRRLRLVQ